MSKVTVVVLTKNEEKNIVAVLQNAKKLANINKGKKASQSTPGTEVYRLIEKLLPYLK